MTQAAKGATFAAGSEGTAPKKGPQATFSNEDDSKNR
jgi:hypothetical protein